MSSGDDFSLYPHHPTVLCSRVFLLLEYIVCLFVLPLLCPDQWLLNSHSSKDLPFTHWPSAVAPKLGVGFCTLVLVHSGLPAGFCTLVLAHSGWQHQPGALSSTQHASTSASAFPFPGLGAMWSQVLFRGPLPAMPFLSSCLQTTALPFFNSFSCLCVS